MLRRLLEKIIYYEIMCEKNILQYIKTMLKWVNDVVILK